jgi:carbon-monoxide dehydrogenase medium subunit
MKPASFEYVRPIDLDETCAILSADENARIIAGGQSLVPLMAMRLARPSRLVDIARIPALAFVREEGDALVVGAATRQCVVEQHPLIRAKVPLLARVMPWVGHVATRTRGTVGGSLANADPAAEIALVAATLGAALCFRENAKEGEIAACDFFLGPMVTALPPAACLTAVRFPVWRERRVGVGFHEVSARRSDFAFVSAAAQIALDEDGRCRRLAVGIGAATPFPRRLDAVVSALEGAPIEERLVGTAVAAALDQAEFLSDLHASAAYRRRVAITLTVRAILDAAAEAGRAHAG